MSPYKHLRLMFLPLMVLSGYLAGGYWNFLTPVILFIVLPVWQWARLRSWDGEKHSENLYEEHTVSRAIPFLFLPVVIGLVVASLIVSGNATMPFNAWLGLALSVGIVNGSIGFILAHEFIHHHSLKQSWPGYVLLALTNYYHYSIEHIHGHHVYVCTQKDPNTARRGESFYRFLPRAIAGTFMSAIEIERKRLRKNGFGFISLHNRLLLFTCLQLLTWTGIYELLNPKALLFFLIQSVVAITLLYLVNYMQHYGLVREESEKKVEKIAAHHAWLPGGPASAFSIFQMENHADHHLHPTHPYDTLKVHEESPVLPAPYATMIVIALIPPVWYKKLHKRIPVQPKK